MRWLLALVLLVSAPLVATPCYAQSTASICAKSNDCKADPSVDAALLAKWNACKNAKPEEWISVCIRSSTGASKDVMTWRYSISKISKSQSQTPHTNVTPMKDPIQ